MLQSDPVQFRPEGQTPVKSCDEDRPMGDSGGPRWSGAAEESPFNFTPQIIRLHKDHELFEVPEQELAKASRCLMKLWDVSGHKINVANVNAVNRTGTSADTCTCRTFTRQRRTARKRPGRTTQFGPLIRTKFMSFKEKQEN